MISFGPVTSNTIRCLPLIFLNHSSGSSGLECCSVDFAIDCKGAAIPPKPIATAPVAMLPKNLRRPVGNLLTSITVVLDEKKCYKSYEQLRRLQKKLNLRGHGLPLHA